MIIHRADNIEGPYEGRVALQHEGIAQGGLVNTPDGDWYAMLFGDRGSVGRIPYLVPVTFENGWPVLGVDGKVSQSLNLPDNSKGIFGIVASDEFERDISDPKLVTTLNNAASYDSIPYESWQYDKIVPILEGLKKTYETTRYFHNYPDPEYKYLLSSECLIPREVPSNTFEQIHVYNNADIESNVQRLVAASKRPQLKVVQDPRMFFNTW